MADGEDWRDEPPVLLGSAASAGQSNPDARRCERARPLVPVLAAPKAVPAGWPVKQANPVWSWLARLRPPLTVMVTGAEGGVGTSTVTALVAETLAAGSPGPTMVLDQCCSTWGSLSRRLLGQRSGLSGEQARSMLHQGIPTQRVFNAAPATSAGAAVLTDGPAYTPARELFNLVQAACGAMIIDGGLTNLMLTARLDLQPIVVLVGRADVVGAEAVCAALGFLSRRSAVRPVVVLSSPAPADRRRVQAACKLVATAGVAHLVRLPFDDQLAAAKALHLNQTSKSTASACLQMVMGIGKTQEVLGYVS